MGIKIFIIKIIYCIEGRTGRAGRRGEAITFFTQNDSENLRSIANVMRQSGCDIPQFMLEINKKLVIFSIFLSLRLFLIYSFNSMFIHRKEKYKKRKRFGTKNSNGTEKSSKKFKRSKNLENNESNETQEQ